MLSRQMPDVEKRRRAHFVIDTAGRLKQVTRKPTTVPVEQIERTSIVPILMTVEEIADLFRVSRRAVYQWRDRGMLPSIRTPGRGIRFKRADVEAVLNGGAKR